jgi:hypothetical protein
VIPADDKWFARLCLAAVIYFEFERLGFDYPEVSAQQKAALQEIKRELLAEDGGVVKAEAPAKEKKVAPVKPEKAAPAKPKKTSPAAKPKAAAGKK